MVSLCDSGVLKQKCISKNPRSLDLKTPGLNVLNRVRTSTFPLISFKKLTQFVFFSFLKIQNLKTGTVVFACFWYTHKSNNDVQKKMLIFVPWQFISASKLS